MYKTVNIFTHGVCSGNPGTGGYAASLSWNGHEKVVSGGFRYTTNGRMQLQPMIAALQLIKEPCVINLYSEAEFVVKAVSRLWLMKWVENGWYKIDGQPVRNQDLWKQLYPLLTMDEAVVLHHVTEPIQGILEVIKLARAAERHPNLPADYIYEDLAGVRI